jgi:hypothetical protein
MTVLLRTFFFADYFDIRPFLIKDAYCLQIIIHQATTTEPSHTMQAVRTGDSEAGTIYTEGRCSGT